MASGIMQTFEIVEVRHIPVDFMLLIFHCCLKKMIDENVYCTDNAKIKGAKSAFQLSICKFFK